MTFQLRMCCSAVLWFAATMSSAVIAEPPAVDPAAEALVQRAVAAAGGEERLLRVFRLKERLILNPDGVKTGTERTSVLAPPRVWWVGKKERVSAEREPAIFLEWAWTLGALTDPASKLEPLPELRDGEQPLVGVRVSGTIDPPLDVYFDSGAHRLARIDWRKDTHRFSEWRELDGLHYPSRTIGVKPTGKVWYQTDILELEQLEELPPELRQP